MININQTDNRRLLIGHDPPDSIANHIHTVHHPLNILIKFTWKNIKIVSYFNYLLSSACGGIAKQCNLWDRLPAITSGVMTIMIISQFAEGQVF